MISTFGRSVAELIMISNKVTEWMYNVHGHRITEWNHFIMSPNLLQTYFEAIHVCLAYVPVMFHSRQVQ